MTGPTPAILRALGLPAARMVETNVLTTETFFRTHVGIDLSDPAMLTQWVDYLRGIDFHHPVRFEWLPKGTKLVANVPTGNRTPKPFIYYTAPGVSGYATGTSFDGFEYREFETVLARTPALVSRASDISFARRRPKPGQKWGAMDTQLRRGGGVQYIIAFSDAPALQRVGKVTLPGRGQRSVAP